MAHVNGTPTKARFEFETPNEIAFDNQPPREGPELYVLRLKGNTMYTFTIYSRALTGLWVHWGNNKSEAHFRDERTCPGCLARRPKRWKGFLHCYCREKSQEVLLELTPHSAKSLLHQLGGTAEVRGNCIQVKRTKGDNGRLVIAVLTRCATPQDLPEEKDPRISIMALWGFDQDSMDKSLKNADGENEGARFT